MDTLEQELLASAAPEETSPETLVTPEESGPEGSAVLEKMEQPAPKKKREWNFLPVLAVLLIVLGIGELAFWSFAGFSVYRHSQEQKQREEQTAIVAIPGGRAQTSVSGSDRDGDGTAQTGTAASSGEKRMSTLSVPKIPYTLAEMEVPPGTDPSLTRLSTLSVPRIPYTLAEQDETP